MAPARSGSMVSALCSQTWTLSCPPPIRAALSSRPRSSRRVCDGARSRSWTSPCRGASGPKRERSWVWRTAAWTISPARAGRYPTTSSRSHTPAARSRRSGFSHRALRNGSRPSARYARARKQSAQPSSSARCGDLDISRTAIGASSKPSPPTSRMRCCTSPSSRCASAAVPAREDARDVIVTRDRRGLGGLRAGHRVGTSSPRRDAFLRALVPGVECAAIRGNVDTRLRKVRDGEYDATVLAAAGLRRLGIAFADAEAMPLDICPPAPGQGALAVQMRSDHPLLARMREALDDPPTRAAVEAEREVLRLAGATCAVALGLYARSMDGVIVAHAALATDDGITRAEAAGRVPGDVARALVASLGALARA